MTQKISRPVVKMPALFKIMNMLDPSLRGKTDRRFLKQMTFAVADYERNRNRMLRSSGKEEGDKQ